MEEFIQAQLLFILHVTMHFNNCVVCDNPLVLVRPGTCVSVCVCVCVHSCVGVGVHVCVGVGVCVCVCL